MGFQEDLQASSAFVVRQRKELAELFGFESRNKYEISTQDGRAIAYAAEQQKGFLGFLLRQFLGHWRRFEIHFFSPGRQPLMVARHPFRVFFQRLEVADPQGRPLGALQQRFSILSKRFDVEDAVGNVVMTVRSPIWKIWTFPFERDGQTVAAVKKKWSGVLKEMITDADNFLVEASPQVPAAHRALLLASAVFIDLQYFEKKATRSE